MREPNYIEQIRRRVGLSQVKFAELLGVPVPVLERVDHNVPVTARTRADQILRRYTQYVANMRRAIEEAAASSDGVLTARQAAQVLGVGDYQLSTMRNRGKIRGTRQGRNHVYSRDDLLACLDPRDLPGYHGPLTEGFLSYLAAKEPVHAS